ncbi:hypothetical protein [Helicobacter sp. T3_23-1056]
MTALFPSLSTRGLGGWVFLFRKRHFVIARICVSKFGAIYSPIIIAGN